MGVENGIAQDGEVKWSWQQGAVGRIGGSRAPSVNWHESGSWRSKGNCSNRIKPAGRPSQPCLGAAKQSLGFMWKTTGRNNHFQGKTKHYDLEVDVFCMSSWAQSTLSLREIRFQMIIDICWVFVVWVSLTFETTLYLCSGAKDHSVCGSVGSVKRWHSGLRPYNTFGVRFSHQLTSVSLSDVLSFFSFTIFPPLSTLLLFLKQASDHWWMCLVSAVKAP